MNHRLIAIRRTATEIMQRHASTAPVASGGFMDDASPPAPTAAQMARCWAERALREHDPDTAKALLDQAVAFDRYEARDTLAKAERQAQQRRSAGGKARAAQRPDLAALVREKALQARERRQRPFGSARETADAIKEQVNIALQDRDAPPVKLDTIRRKVPPHVGPVTIYTPR